MKIVGDTMEYSEVMAELKALSNPEAVKGMASVGINPECAYGISIPALRKLARKFRKAILQADGQYYDGSNSSQTAKIYRRNSPANRNLRPPLRRGPQCLGSAWNHLGPPSDHMRTDQGRCDHWLRLPAALWESGIHEARILATMIADVQSLSEEQMERWVRDFNSWDLCDQCCNNLFRKSRFAHAKAVQWSDRAQEFVKRAGFVLMACLAVHDKQAPDSAFAEYLAIIEGEAHDTRNFVKKAVNWALRQIGKRNVRLNSLAVQTAHRISRSDSKAARWVASDALRELTSAGVRARLGITVP